MSGDQIRYPIIGEKVNTPGGIGTVVKLVVEVQYNGLYNESESFNHLNRVLVTVWWGMDDLRELPGQSGYWSWWTFPLSEVSLVSDLNESLTS